MSASTTGLTLNGKRSSLKPHRLNKLVFSHDNFDIIVESTDSTRSGDEPELRDDASGARTSNTGTDGLLKKCSSQFCQTVLVNNSYFDCFMLFNCTFKYWFRHRPVALHH
jgi:hypothetical protein